MIDFPSGIDIPALYERIFHSICRRMPVNAQTFEQSGREGHMLTARRRAPLQGEEDSIYRSWPPYPAMKACFQSWGSSIRPFLSHFFSEWMKRLVFLYLRTTGRSMNR